MRQFSKCFPSTWKCKIAGVFKFLQFQNCGSFNLDAVYVAPKKIWKRRFIPWLGLPSTLICHEKGRMLLENLSVQHLNEIFGSFFWTNGTALFPLRIRNRLNRITWSEFSDASGPGTYHVNKKHGGWTSCRATRFIGRLRKLLVFGEEGDNFFFWLLQHPQFVRETSNQHPHLFPRCSSDGSTPESRIMQAKEKQKYRPQNVIRSVSPAGLQLCSITSTNTTDEQRHTL